MPSVPTQAETNPHLGEGDLDSTPDDDLGPGLSRAKESGEQDNRQEHLHLFLLC